MNTPAKTGQPDSPNFRDSATLRAHVRHTLSFYDPVCVDASGGFFHFYRDDGRVYDSQTRHLVSSTRFVFNYAMAYRHFGGEQYRQMMRHGLRFLRDAHRQPDTGGYLWCLRWQDGAALPIDADNHCYGLAFVMLAYAHAALAGEPEAVAWMDDTWALMEARFWNPEAGLYADVASADWSRLDPYRGQNANMHACEAMLAAFDATADQRYLLRSETLARNITMRQAALSDGQIWEHYKSDWLPDWDYNRDDKTNIFRPWGIQPGHLTEWAKLLLTLERHRALLADDGDWLLPRAQALFSQAMRHAWDREHGGLVYGFAPDGEVCDADKYFWVQAESLAAAGLLALRTGEAQYWAWYDLIWSYAWDHMIDHQHGAWFRILKPDNSAYSDEKSPAGKTDYHTMGACYEMLAALERAAS
ncbi:AGE family epimerase/isomerase [Roseateles albus]|uniref:AGE family epimerase/isomerase n=1 Tax=Roseateles albus TaxID=2987525 RepID=A0ABT5KBW1_9BURK|nr:AGE family epimerase/isomerase [Roseateles albus]MDC8771426.1 AGE family epimerase/isomerase [Roseateles albus]